jgi:hypothetical protein
MAPKNKGVKNTKKKPLNVIKVGSQTPIKFLACCFVLVKVLR